MIVMACKQPFTAIEINSNGDVFTCCPNYIKMRKIGNIWQNTFEEIWYSDFARELRSKILKNDFSLCDMDLCRQYSLAIMNDAIIDNMPLPQYVTLAYDKECNLCCITCRDKKYNNTSEQIELYNEKIDSLLLPLLTEARILALSGSGEAFYSKHSRLLIQKVAAYNKQLMFNINTNGLLFNEANCKKLGILGRINEVFVSLPSINESTYSKIQFGSILSVVLSNISEMANMQARKLIKKVTINMVISSLNYKEIPAMVEFAKNFDIGVTISQYYNWGTNLGKNYQKLAVWLPENSEYADFKQVLKHTDLDYPKCYCSHLFSKIAGRVLS